MAGTKRQRLKAPADVNLDLFSQVEVVPPANVRCSDSLPAEEELLAMFDEFNLLYFGNSLPRPKIEWSSRMKHAGKCEPRAQLIRLGRAYHEHYPEDIVDTLKHEMIHLVYPNHGPEFRREAERIGTSRYARHYPGMLKGMKYIYQCPTCGAEYPSRKMLRMRSCGPCSKGKYDGRHKLRFVRNI